jgi:serine/threonine protein kinase
VNLNFSADNADAGSLMYLAPELLLKKPNCISPALDIWAIGCILYGMVCGELPFQGKDNKEKLIAESIVKGEFNFPADVSKKLSKEIKDLIKKILNVNPINRLTLNEIFDHPWVTEKKMPE